MVSLTLQLVARVSKCTQSFPMSVCQRPVDPIVQYCTHWHLHSVRVDSPWLRRFHNDSMHARDPCKFNKFRSFLNQNISSFNIRKRFVVVHVRIPFSRVRSLVPVIRAGLRLFLIQVHSSDKLPYLIVLIGISGIQTQLIVVSDAPHSDILNRLDDEQFRFGVTEQRIALQERTRVSDLKAHLCLYLNRTVSCALAETPLIAAEKQGVLMRFCNAKIVGTGLGVRSTFR